MARSTEMTRLVIDRSTDVQSLAWCEGGAIAEAAVLDGLDCRSGDWVMRTAAFLGSRRPDEIVVGTGPGSFAGIRAALAFAQGWALGAKCEVLGLESAAALAREGEKIAVVGDARQGKFWVALYDGFAPVGEIFQVDAASVGAAVPIGFSVTTSDARRIDGALRETFASRYLGGSSPLAENLARAAFANPALLRREPLPTYLNPAVRPANG